MIAGGIGVGAGRSIAVLRGENEALAMTLHEFPEKPLTRAVRVQIGRIDEVSARLSKRIVDGSGRFRPGAPAPVIAERHRSEA